MYSGLVKSHPEIKEPIDEGLHARGEGHPGLGLCLCMFPYPRSSPIVRIPSNRGFL